MTDDGEEFKETEGARALRLELEEWNRREKEAKEELDHIVKTQGYAAMIKFKIECLKTGLFAQKAFGLYSRPFFSKMLMLQVKEDHPMGETMVEDQKMMPRVNTQGSQV